MAAQAAVIEFTTGSISIFGPGRLDAAAFTARGELDDSVLGKVEVETALVGGSIDATVRINVTTERGPTISTDQVTIAPVRLGVGTQYQASISSQFAMDYETRYNPTGPGDFLVGEDRIVLDVDASGAFNAGGVFVASGSAKISQVVAQNLLGGDFGVRNDIDASVTTILSADLFNVLVRAEHESGAIVSRTAFLGPMSNFVVPLALTKNGRWDLSITGTSLQYLMIHQVGVQEEIRLASTIGFGCGNVFDPSDDSSTCATRTFADEIEGLDTSSSPDRFSAPFSGSTAGFGSIFVSGIVSPPPTAVVPLPSAGWMLIGGVGLLGWMRRRPRALQDDQ